MKGRRKRITLFLCMLAVLGMVLSLICTGNEVKAEETAATETMDGKKILFNERWMTGSENNFPFKSTENTSCKTNYFQVVMSAGDTSIISYTAPSDGFIRVREMQVSFHSSHTTGTGTCTGREFEFAVTNEEGEILSNGGDILVLNASKTTIGNLSIAAQEIRKGENLHFVFHANEGSTNLAVCTSTIEFSEDGNTWTQVNRKNAAVPWPTDYDNTTVTQGAGDFYYQYSGCYQVVDCAEAYRLSVNTRQMTESLANATWPLVYDATHCKTNIGEIIVSAGYTNVISYQAESDGRICIDMLKVWDNKTDTSRKFEFAVIDEEGRILSNNGQVYTASSGGGADSAEDLIVPVQDIKAGERIYFVFHGTQGNIQTLRCKAKIMFCEEGSETWASMNPSTWDMSLRSSEATENGKMKQGLGGFYYEYSVTYKVEEYQEPEYVYIEPANMDAGKFTHASFPFEQAAYHCMTNPSEIIVSAGYTNVIAYEASEAGAICIDDLQVWIGNAGEGKQAEFAVLDETGKILSNNGRKYTVASCSTAAEAKAYAAEHSMVVEKLEVNAGDRIYFVFHGTQGTTNTLRCKADILFCKAGDTAWTTVNSSSFSADMTLYTTDNWTSTDRTKTPTQGLGGFYYQYSAHNTSAPAGVTIGTEAEGKVTVYEEVASGSYYGDKYVIEAGEEISYIDIDMLNIKKQSKENADNATQTDVRFISSVDNLSYQKAGFLFSVDPDSELTCETIPEKANRATYTVYSRMLDNGTYRKASNIYAEDGCSTAYAYAFEMTGIPAGKTIYVRAYVLLEDGATYVYGEPSAVTITQAGTAE